MKEPEIGNHNESFYQAVVHASMDGYLLVDLEGKIIETNEAYVRMSGFSSEELLSMSIRDLEDQETPEAIRNHIDFIVNAGSHRFESKHRQKSGSCIYVDVSCYYLPDPNRLIVSFIRDTTFEKMKMLELRRLEKLESLSLLAAGIGHDFRNLFTPIMACASLLTLEQSDENRVEIAEEIITATTRANELAKKLMVFSRTSIQEEAIIPVEATIREVVDFAVGKRSPHTVHYDFDSNLWAISGDASELQQVIDNLVVNALTAMTSPGEIRIRATNVHGPLKYYPSLTEERYIHLQLTDSGSGIPHHLLEKIFDPYFTTKPRGQGTGLGLAICHEVIRKHRGIITVHSEVGYGTTFHIFLPAVASTPVELLPMPENRSCPPLRILILDDEEIIRKTLHRVLGRLGHDAISTADGSEAIAAFTSAIQHGHPFDCVIFDLTIPGGIGGQEALSEIKRIHPCIRSIASSGYSDVPVNGFDAMLNKPYTINEVSNLLAKMFGV